VLLVEFTKIATNCFASTRHKPETAHAIGRPNYSSIFLLSFLCAFSLEAYAAIILIALLATWIAIVIIRLYFLRRTEHPKLEPFGRDFVLFAHSSLWASFFCIVSLLLTLRFSGRAEGGMDSHLSFMSNLMRLQLSVLAENDVIRLIVAYGKTV